MACDSNFNEGYQRGVKILKSRWNNMDELNYLVRPDIFGYFEVRDEDDYQTWRRALLNVRPAKADYTNETIDVKFLDTSSLFLQPIKITDWERTAAIAEKRKMKKKMEKMKKGLKKESCEDFEECLEYNFHEYIMTRVNAECHIYGHASFIDWLFFFSEYYPNSLGIRVIKQMFNDANGVLLREERKIKEG